MNVLIYRGGKRALFAIVLGLYAAAGVFAQETRRDLLEIPAIVRSGAENSVMMAVSRAGDRLVSVGERGTVLLSDDDGLSWRQAREVPVSVALTSVAFADPRQGWITGHGGVVLHTADGGETWRKQLDGRVAAQLELQAAKAQLAVDPQAAAPRLKAAYRMVDDGPDKPFLDLYFADTKHGIAVGAYGLAVITDDGGETWRSIGGQMDNPAGMHLYAILADEQGVVITGEQGTLLRSTGLGQAFERLESPYTGTYFGALRTADGRLLAFGLRGNAYALAGTDWQPLNTGNSTLTAGKRLPDGTLLMVDEGGRLLLSSDNGQSFRTQALNEVDGAAITDLELTPSGALVVTGLRGVKRVVAKSLVGENKQ
ncbi:hypothetical protein GR140_28795 (plasmid) [Pseudomonas putida]|uniref:WD40/YVTN/BNR-like repeat-containing protein n=1 Tax=Pseudomonas putida TaxID=303 RepID=UPI001BAFDEDC|nr:YCF48-related protein [Pseudomonas putida]QUG92762.1 hypothetical protein GR140_28795 [Pseudomonas putida]